jgi:hypothetical protein
MCDKVFLNTEELALRWGCDPKTLYSAKPENMPARFARPGSRLVLYPLREVEAFERAHTEARDYEAERRLGAKPVFAQLSRGSRPFRGARS